MVNNSILEDLEELKEEVDELAIGCIKGFAFAFFLNLFMAIWYEQDRTTFHVVLQTIHLIGLAILIKGTVPTFMVIRKTSIRIKKLIENEKN